MASKKNFGSTTTKNKKKTSIGNGTNTKHKQPGAHGGNKGYKKRYRGQGR
jgi:hypothetical protein